ncbi:MAG: hypothetical protein E7016_05550 [Alphaproteobacteria bacterium]|nr:hypothetical protein [Alphaproteobacteria bacterium]
MLANTVTYLLFIAIFSLLRFRPKFDKFIIAGLTVACLWVFNRFCLDWQLVTESITTLVWDSSKSGDVKIDIVSNRYNYMLIFPFFVITLLSLLNNLLFKFEDKKRIFSAILILNLLSLILLISTTNLVGIITFVFVIDILSQFFINNTYASRRYSIYNLIADMGLFMIMAMLKGKLDNLEIGNIAHYYETGRHRDFIMFAVMISLFIKFGFFLFQSYLLDLKNTKFHKLILILYLSTPMVALILVMKLYPLLVVSPSFDLCLNIILALTMFWGTIGTIVANNLKEKTVYLNMMLISMVVKLLQGVDFVFDIHLALVLIACFVLNLCLYYVHYYVGRENNLYAVEKVSKTGICITLCAYIITSVAFLSELSLLVTDLNLIWVDVFIGLFIIASAHIFSQILYLKDKQKLGFDFYPLFILCICTFGALYIIKTTGLWWLYIFAFVISFLVMVKIYPLRFVLYNKLLNEKLQKIDFFAHFYDVLIVNPIKIIGRWLTVLFDFMFIEKTLTAMFSSLNGFTIRIFRKSARHWAIYYLFNVIVAMVVVLWCFFKGDKQ